MTRMRIHLPKANFTWTDIKGQGGNTMNNIFEEANQLKPELIDIRRTIHQCPEVGPVLPKTKEFGSTELISP